MKKVHHFADQNAWSEQVSMEAWLKRGYESFFKSSIVEQVFHKEKEVQLSGTDKTIRFGGDSPVVGCSEVAVEEKLRTEDYGDFAVEHSHINKDGSGGRIGWSHKKMSADYLAYIIVPTKKIYMLDTETFFSVVNSNAYSWSKYARDPEQSGYRWISADNPTYTTWGICVPLTVLSEAMISAGGTFETVECSQGGLKK